MLSYNELTVGKLAEIIAEISRIKGEPYSAVLSFHNHKGRPVSIRLSVLDPSAAPDDDQAVNISGPVDIIMPYLEKLVASQPVPMPVPACPELASGSLPRDLPRDLPREPVSSTSTLPSQ